MDKREEQSFRLSRHGGFHFTLCCLTLVVFEKGVVLDLRNTQGIIRSHLPLLFAWLTYTLDPNDFPAQGELACFVHCCIPPELRTELGK